MTFLGQLSQLLLFCAMIAGLVIIPFGLPGVAVIFISVLLYGLATDFNADIGMNFFLVLCALTVVAETADNWLMLLGARKFGASSPDSQLCWSVCWRFFGCIPNRCPFRILEEAAVERGLAGWLGNSVGPGGRNCL
jgi:hypothetical protein